MTPATEFYLDAYLLMLALVALLFALVGVQRLAWWLADRPRRRVGDDLAVVEYEDAADAEADALILAATDWTLWETEVAR